MSLKEHANRFFEYVVRHPRACASRSTDVLQAKAYSSLICTTYIYICALTHVAVAVHPQIDMAPGMRSSNLSETGFEENESRT